jgi:hypothetical protein
MSAENYRQYKQREDRRVLRSLLTSCERALEKGDITNSILRGLIYSSIEACERMHANLDLTNEDVPLTARLDLLRCQFVCEADPSPHSSSSVISLDSVRRAQEVAKRRV